MRKGTTTLVTLTILASLVAMTFGGTQVSAELGNMKAYWQFDSGIGSVAYDSSDSLNDGILSGGKFGNALEFDGTDDYVDMPDDDSLDITGDLTVEAWIVADVINTYKSIIVKGDAYTEGKINYGLQIQAEQAAGTIRFFVWSPGYTWVDSTSQIPLDGNWHHVAVTHDTSNNVKIFIDGILSGSGTLALGPISNSPLDIGRHKHATVGIYQYWDGKIDEVRISNVVRYTTNFELQTNAFTSDANTALSHFDESVGTTVYDETTNNNDGAIYEAVWVGPTWVAGKYGTALQMDGIDDYITVPDDVSLEPSLITLEAWVKSSNPGGSNRYIVGKGARLCTASSYAFYTRGGGLYFYIYNPSYGYKLSPGYGSGIWDGQWHHIAGTYDGSTLRLYVDGTEVGSGASTTIDIGYGLPTTDDLIMGKYGGTCHLPFRGAIDNVRIWDNALTECEIQLAIAGKLDILPEAGIIVYYNSLHDLVSGQTVLIEILPSDTSITIVDVTIHRVTPTKKNSVQLTPIIDNQRCYDVEVTINDVPAKVKTVHIWVHLSTGEHVPVNLHYGH
jgi:hypothetical protein